MAERMSKGTKGCSASAASSSSGGGVGLPTWSTSASTSASISTSISASLRRMVRSSWSRRAVGPSAMLPRPTAIPAAHEMSTARPTGRTLTALGPVIRMKATATATVIATKSGCRSCARRAGARVRWTAVITTKLSAPAVIPPSRGLATHATTVCSSGAQPIPAEPCETRPTASRPPMTPWLALIGSPYKVASSVVDPVPASTLIIPTANARTPSHPSAAYSSGLMTPLLMVLATEEPSSTAPANSAAAPYTMA